MQTNEHEANKPPERIDSVNLLGTTVMAGRYENGEIEVRLWNTNPVTPQVAAADLDEKLRPESVLE
jgi:hypothetical protein